MTPDVVILHAGHGQVTLPEYVLRVLAHLLAFAAVATVARGSSVLLERCVPGASDGSDGDG